ncbi:MAG: MFS transporter [Desulfobacterales bacterium]|nr:MFS transporter [Desulfobacterales bacterium]
MKHIAAPENSNFHRWVVFLMICIIYFFVYFHRVSTSVIAADLLAEFQANATALGIMSSMYFYLYAFEQPVVGYFTDKLGPRRVIAYWSIAAAAGCVLFGLATGINWAMAARALIGIGVGGVYVPALKALSLWYRQNEFPTMVGLLMSVGNMGAIIATTPLAWAAGAWGWRPTFFLIAAITLGLAFATLFFTRDHQTPPETLRDQPAPDADAESNAKPNALRVIASGQFWIVAAVFFGIYGTLITLQGLWATPFLMTTLGTERLFASKLNMLIPIGVIFGAPFSGWLLDRFSFNKRKTLIVILAIYTMAWVAMIQGKPDAIRLSVIFVVMGVVGGGFIITLWGIVRDTTPPELMGLTSGLLNSAPFVGVAVFQVATGAILDRAGMTNGLYPAIGFQNAFLACLAGIVLCLILSFFIRKQIQKGS